MELLPICSGLCKLQRLLSNFFLLMRIASFLLLAGFLHVSAHGFGQEKINFSAKQIPLEKFFREIERQSGYSIWYDASIPERKNLIDIDLKNASLTNALDTCCL